MKSNYDTLIAAARGGDGAALENLFSHLLPRVHRIVHRSLTRDVRRGRPWFHALFSTSDVVQDIFVGILRNVGGLPARDETALTNYLSILTRNRLVDAIRFHEATRRDQRRNRESCERIDIGECRSAGPEEQAITREQIERFHSVLSTFPERERALLRERLENEVPFDELAERLGFASGDSARKMFHIARARLLARLRPE